MIDSRNEPAHNSGSNADKPRPGSLGGGGDFDPHAEITQLREKVESLMAAGGSPAVSNALGQVEAVAHNATDAVRHQAESLKEFVHEKPAMALAAAALAGFVLALVIRR